MPVLRNKLSSTLAGGPRQFAELRNKVIIRTDEAEREEVRGELAALGLEFDELDNAPVFIGQPINRLDQFLDRITEVNPGKTVEKGIEQVGQAIDNDAEVIDITDSAVEATDQILRALNEIGGVDFAEFVRSEADFGPANLRIDVQSRRNMDGTEAKDSPGNIEDLYERLGIYDAWDEHGTRGENAIYAVFDTGYAEDLISSDRIVGTFHDDSVDSVFESAEGHGTMCAGCAVANSDENPPIDGVAPDADVVLVRTTGADGQIKTDTIANAWDWLVNQEFDKPVVANHSYGTPICSGRPRQDFCGSSINEVVRLATSDSDITAVYAAGNEAMRCGHRPGGFTNAITGTNSINSVIAVGAMLTNGRGPQRYSSHGRGDCAPISDPKPNVAMPIPMVTYYGGKDGFKLKDLSTGISGSGGGTSHASPTTAGVITLMQSKAASNGGALQTEEIKDILHDTSSPPRTNHINNFGLLFSEEGYDARYGHGQVKVSEALSRV